MRQPLLLLLTLLMTGAGLGQTASFPDWKPPEARLKAKTPFAPKPTKGNNIFDGEKETWLSDAVLKTEAGYLSEIKDPDLDKYLDQLGNYLAEHSAIPTSKYEIRTVSDPSEDAFSVGAGRIYIDLGMLKEVKSEDELAAILAHEIGHDQFKHMPKTVTRQFFWMIHVTKIKSQDEVQPDLEKLLKAYEKNLFASAGELLLGWSRNDELQADKAGFYTMYKAGYNPEAMKNVFRHYVTEEKKKTDYSGEYLFTLLFGDHPPSSQRVTALKWESLWIKMPPHDDEYKSAAFDAMKLKVAGL